MRLKDIDDTTDEWVEIATDNCECVVCQPDLDDRHDRCIDWCWAIAVPLLHDDTRMTVEQYMKKQWIFKDDKFYLKDVEQ